MTGYKTNRADAERDAMRWSALDQNNPDTWLVVDYSNDIAVPDYQVWREETIRQSQPANPYEIVARAHNGRLEQIA